MELVISDLLLRSIFESSLRLKLIMKNVFYSFGLFSIIVLVGCSEPAKVEGLKEKISDHAQMQNGHRVMNTAYAGMSGAHDHFVSDLQANGDTVGLGVLEASHQAILAKHQEIEKRHQELEKEHEHTLLEYKAGKIDDLTLKGQLDMMVEDHEKFMSDHEMMKKHFDKIKEEHVGMEGKHNHNHNHNHAH